MPLIEGALAHLGCRVVAAFPGGDHTIFVHAVACWGWLPPTALMVYGPRDEKELEAVWSIVKACYAFARGEEPQNRA